MMLVNDDTNSKKLWGKGKTHYFNLTQVLVNSLGKFNVYHSFFLTYFNLIIVCF